jgi:hypothetical protein
MKYRCRRSLTVARIQVQALTHIDQTLTHKGQNTDTDAHTQRLGYRYRHSLAEVRILVQTLINMGQNSGTDTC